MPKQKHSSAGVARALAGAITLSPVAAGAVASELGKLDLDELEPDEAGRQVQAAVSRAVLGKSGAGSAQHRAVISIDTALVAIERLRGERELEAAAAAPSK